jgi:hypothetical protein
MPLLKELLGAYRFKNRLHRLPFLVAILTVFLVVGIGESAIRDGFLCPDDGINCLVAAAFGLFAVQAIAIFPPCVARLWDIGWPRALAVFPAILALLTYPIQMVVSLLNKADVISTSYYHSGLNLIGSTLLLFCLFVLVLVKGSESG